MNQIKAGAILNYVIIGLNTVVGLAYTPYMLRCLGQNEYGLYSLVASVIAYLTILDFGFGNAIIRYTAKFRAEGKQREQWEMFGMFLIIYSVIGLFAVAGGLVLYFNVDALFDRTMTHSDLSQARMMMLLLSLNLAFTFPLSIFGSIISAYENFIFQRGVNILRIILSTGVLIFVLSIGYKAVALVIVQTAFNLLTLIINLIYCKNKLKIRVIFTKFNWTFLKEISLYSFWLFLGAIVDRIYWGSGQFVLGALIGTAAVAIFSVAILFQQLYTSFSGAISNVLLPRITSIITNSENSTKAVSDIFIRIGRLQYVVLVIVLSGFIVFGKEFIFFWAGKGYEQVYCLTLILWSGLLIPLIQNTGVIILQARNKMQFRAIAYIITSIICVALQIFLTEFWGIIGCAIAISGCLLLGQGLVINIYYSKSQSIDTVRFWKEIIGMSICPIAFTFVSFIIVKALQPNSFFQLIMYIAIFTICIIILMFRFSMKSDERNLIGNSLKKLQLFIKW